MFWSLGVSSPEDLTLSRRVGSSCLLISSPLFPLLFFPSPFPPHHLAQETELCWLEALVPFRAAVSEAGFWGSLCLSAPPILPASPAHLRSPALPLPPALPSSPSVRDYLIPPAGPLRSRWLDFSCLWLAVPFLTSPADPKIEKKEDMFLGVGREWWGGGWVTSSISESTGSFVVGWGF